MKFATSFVVFVALCAWIRAECPNGCSGNGDCMAKDMCNCYKNFQGNDCGDRTCLFGYAHVDTPKGDIDMDRDRKTGGWILLDSQQAPAKTYEYFNPDASRHEAHFYMECSNKGICDRATGLCQCFDGYEGNGCQRTTCPNKCSGHGTCESIHELGKKNGGTLAGNEQPGGAVLYDLWDRNSTYGCRCDPWHFGPDCSKRSCKVGVDPMYLSAGNPIYETFIVHSYILPTGGNPQTIPANSWVRLRVFDYHGESFITNRISISTTSDQDANAAAVKTAILAIPNQSFDDIDCERLGQTNGDLLTFSSTLPTDSRGLSVICRFVSNPGRLRIPEIASFDFPGIATNLKKATVVTTSNQGMDDEWLTELTTIKFAAIDATKLVITVTSTGTDLATHIPTNAARLVKFGTHILLVLSRTGNDLTLAYKFPHTITVDTPMFVAHPDARPTITAFATDLAQDVNVGDEWLIYGADVSTTFSPGDTIYYHNIIFSIQQVEPVPNTANWRVRLHKPFGGIFDGSQGLAADDVYEITLPADMSKIYNYVSECSGRGLCAFDTGICDCFKGYSNDNCDTQNIIAL